jgi:hypothetical protein
MRRALQLTVVIASSLCFLGSALCRELTDAEARELVVLSLDKGVSSLPRFGLDPYHGQSDADFYLYEATAQHPRGGSPVIGQFAVNKGTADVWRLCICKKLHSASLTRAQREIREKARVKTNEFQRLTVKAPCQP